ncbi:hypothetical protein Ais01nite_14970 [Asanoa ishikariensis]|uniref:Lipoprotein with Yx(FWY)xxD motif n=1 Tax=Asanoa ishikariensis TaxID=137265 RepID=A0A1H3UI53_9ACTN|nr:hypothetical protein [Asanoa ishikariensis]GIF63462.1 hypothetical protein Ais01nite_14970 [Asanoa ishikariensis]SDZ62090.1 Secreted repeat of unknown function [Asanoa ishikariensis]
MAPLTRTLFSVGAVAAMAALAACAPTSDGGAAQVAAQLQIAATPTPTAAPPEEPAPDAPEAPDVALTTELNGKSVPKMGQVVTDQDGFVLYRFDNDSADPSATTCEGNCARVWPPAYTDSTPKLSGVALAKVGTVTRKDGTQQLTIGGWPLYRYIGDKEPGQWKGQKVGNVWFVVKPDGKKNLSCLPKGTPKAVAPPPLEEDAVESTEPPAEGDDGYDTGTGGY